MKENSTHSLNIPPEIYEALNHISACVGLSAEHLAEGVLSRYVKRSKANEWAARENRKFQREAMHVPAILSFWDEAEKVSFYKIAWIQDLSLSGIRLVMERKERLFRECASQEPPQEFDILFSLAGGDEHMAYRCHGARFVEMEDNVCIAAEFVHSYNNAHLILQRYFM
jgi:hypothetical protein